MAEFYSARGWEIPPLPWTNLSPPFSGLIHHSDRGSQYCSIDYQAVLKKHGLLISMSGKGNCYDNAVVETFFKTIKSELIWPVAWQTRGQAENAVARYIDGFYNPIRRHSTLGYRSPVQFETCGRPGVNKQLSTKPTQVHLCDRAPQDHQDQGLPLAHDRAHHGLQAMPVGQQEVAPPEWLAPHRRDHSRCQIQGRRKANRTRRLKPASPTFDGAVKSRFLMRVGWVIIVHVYFTRPTDRRIV